jgi:hypothetical protein
MKSYVCEDAKHEGDRLIPHPFDAFEIRLEARRLSDQRGRTNVQIVGCICRRCLPFRLDEMKERLPRMQQGSFQ